MKNILKRMSAVILALALTVTYVPTVGSMSVYAEENEQGAAVTETSQEPSVSAAENPGAEFDLTFDGEGRPVVPESEGNACYWYVFVNEIEVASWEAGEEAPLLNPLIDRLIRGGVIEKSDSYEIIVQIYDENMGDLESAYGIYTYASDAEPLEVADIDIAYKIAAHAGDVARGLPGARARDDAMSDARAAFDWDRQFSIALDPERARMRWLRTRAFTDEAHNDDHCSMCGKEFCAVRTSRRIRELAEKRR